MIAGQDVSFINSLTISLVGFSIVFLELILLAGCVVVLSKIMANVKETGVAAPKKAPAPVAAPAVVAAPIAAPVTAPVAIPVDSEMDDELIVVMTTVLEESGFNPDEVIFKSITKI